MKTVLFQSCGHCWVFQICWHIECSTFIASSFRIWNNSAGILSPPLNLFVVMLPKAHLTSHSRMSGCSWVITPTPTWLSGPSNSFFAQFFCVFLPPLLNILCFSLVHTVSFLCCAHLCMKCSLGISNYLEEIASLSLSNVFLYFFALITEEGFLSSTYYSLKLCIQMTCYVPPNDLPSQTIPIVLSPYSVPASLLFSDLSQHIHLLRATAPALSASQDHFSSDTYMAHCFLASYIYLLTLGIFSGIITENFA